MIGCTPRGRLCGGNGDWPNHAIHRYFHIEEDQRALQHLNRMCSRIHVHIKHRGKELVGQLINLRLIEIILYKNLNRLGPAELFEIGDIDPPILVKIMPKLFQCF